MGRTVNLPFMIVTKFYRGSLTTKNLEAGMFIDSEGRVLGVTVSKMREASGET
jgi:hypothetical protein